MPTVEPRNPEIASPSPGGHEKKELLQGSDIGHEPGEWLTVGFMLNCCSTTCCFVACVMLCFRILSKLKAIKKGWKR